MSESTRVTKTPKPLPDALLRLEPTSKTLWLFIRGIGTAQVSQRRLAEVLGTTQASISSSFNSLREHHLLEGEFPKGKTPTYRAVVPDIKN